MRKYVVTVTANADGDGTGYTADTVNGRVVQITYVKVDYDNGVDFVVSGEDTGVILWDEDNVNASKTVLPRVQVHDTAGVGLTYDGTRPQSEPPLIVGERIKVVVAQAGAGTVGTFHVCVGVE